MPEPAPTRELMPGLQLWKNPGNQFTVLRIHYTADPEKRKPEWLKSAKAGMPHRGWRRELEIDFASPEGDPVVPEFDEQVHVREMATLRGLRTVRGWDPGFVSPAVVLGQITSFGQLRILDEVNPFNTPLDSLVEHVRAHCLAIGLDVLNPFDAGDPAAAANTELGQVKSMLAKHGVFLYTTRPGTEASYTRFREQFKQQLLIPGYGLEPKVLIHPRCTTLIKALAGAFHLSTNPPYSVVKEHPFKDIVDAFRYLHDNIDHSQVDHQRALAKMATIDRVW